MARAGTAASVRMTANVEARRSGRQLNQRRGVSHADFGYRDREGSLISLGKIAIFYFRILGNICRLPRTPMEIMKNKDGRL